jgi:hypothetical protein
MRRSHGLGTERALRAAASGHNQPRHHARDTRAEVKATLGPRGAAHLRFANVETHGVVVAQAAVTAQLRVALWHELGCDAGADDAAAEALADPPDSRRPASTLALLLS